MGFIFSILFNLNAGKEYLKEKLWQK